MRIERTAKTVIAGLMSVACLASVAACGPGSSSNKANMCFSKLASAL